MPIFDTSDIQTTGFTVTGKAVISGNSSANVLTVSGASNVILTIADNTGSTQLFTVSTLAGTPIFTVTNIGTRINTYLIDSNNSTGATGGFFTQSTTGSLWSSLTTLSSATLTNNVLSITSNNSTVTNSTINAATGGTYTGGILTLAGSGTFSTIDFSNLSATTITGLTIAANTISVGGTGSSFKGPLSGSNITGITIVGTTFTASGPNSAFNGSLSGSNITGNTIVAAGAGSAFSGSLSGSNITGVTISAGTINIGQGTTTLQPLKFTTGGTLLTTAVAGSVESDSSNTLYYTTDIKSRNVVRTEQFVFLTANTGMIVSAAAQRLFTGASFTSGAVVVVANTAYSFETGFDISGMSATLGTFSFGFSGTASVASCRYTAMTIKNVLASANTFDTQVMIRTSGLTPISSATTGTVGAAQIFGTLRIGGVGGTLAPITAFSTAAAGVVGPDSYFKISPLGATGVVVVGNWV